MTRLLFHLSFLILGFVLMVIFEVILLRVREEAVKRAYEQGVIQGKEEMRIILDRRNPK